MPKDSSQDAEKAAKKPKVQHHPLNVAPRPHSDFPNKGGKGAKPAASKGRNFRHQGR